MVTPLNMPLKELRSRGSLWVTRVQKRDILRAEQAVSWTPPSFIFLQTLLEK